MTQFEIEKIAADLLLQTNKKIQFPVDLNALIAFLRIDVCRDDLEGEAGYILHKKGYYRVFLDNSSHHSHAFLRFTLAHEIAHILLDHITTRRNLPDKIKEFEANSLASALLMPFHFMVAYRNLDTRILSCFMGVSEPAMEVRRKVIEKDPFYKIAIEKNLYKENLLKDFRSGLEEVI